MPQHQGPGAPGAECLPHALGHLLPVCLPSHGRSVVTVGLLFLAVVFRAPRQGHTRQVLRGRRQQGSEERGVRWAVEEYGQAGRQDWGLDFQTNAFGGRL